MAIASAASFLAQTSGIRDAETLTWLVAMFTLAEAAGSMTAGWVPRTGAGGLTMLCVLGAGCFGVSALYGSAALPMVLVLAFLTGLAEPLRAAAIQRMAADTTRARAASIANACDMALMLIVLPLSARFWSRRWTHVIK